MRLYRANALVPAMPKAIKSDTDALQALDRYVICTAKGEDADQRARLAGGSMTGDRHRATASNWQEKADAALEALRAYLGAAS